MNLERAILLALAAARKPLPASILAGQISQFISGDYTTADVETALKTSLQPDGEVKGTFNKDFGTLWVATDAGRLRIA